MSITPKTYNNILKYGTQAAYEAMSSYDDNVLYFTSSGKLYKGSVDMTESTRIVSTRPSTPVAGITYLIEATSGTTAEVWDGSNWHVIGYPVATVINSDSTNATVAGAKAVYDAIQVAENHVGDLDDLDTTEKGTVVGAINFVNSIAVANKTAIGTASTETVPGTGIIKDIEDINDTLDTFGTIVTADAATVPIGTAGEDVDAIPSVYDVKQYVTSEIADLEGAMHFRGAVTPTEGQTDEQAMDAWYTTHTDKQPKPGDVFVITTNTKEYVLTEVGTGTGSSSNIYKEIGAEGLYVLKTTTIAGVDLQNNIEKSELLTALNVADGAQVNVIESVKVNGTALTITDKAVNVTVATGSDDGTIAVNGADVAVKGLGSAAFTDSSAYDAAGTASTLVGTLSNLTTEAKTNAVAAINEVDANANAAQATADQNEADIAALAVAVGWGTF